jgi:diamine N-acetyltransferase
MVRLLPVTMANRGDLDDIEPGDPERYLVHANWYWHQVSLEHPAITFRLVHPAEEGEAVGMVACGASYRDRDLTQRIEGDFEIHHLVIDHHHQARGLGRAVVALVIDELRGLPSCRRVVVAINPDNARSRAFFAARGARPIDERNYDGDPMYEIVDPSVGGT